MNRVLVVASGVGVGIAATMLCFLLGLQSRHWRVLATILIGTGMAGAATGSVIARQQKGITRSQLDVAIGRVSERYSLKPSDESLLAETVLQEIKQEVQGNGR